MKNLINTRKNKPIRLYNVFFPLWIILMFPLCWPIVGVVNFLFDSLVLLISLIFVRVPEKDEFYGRHIWKVFGFGFLSDILGALGMYLIMLLLSPFPINVLGDELYLTVSGLIISAVLIFVFNYFITFRKHDFKVKRTLSLIFAIATAPYTFLVPNAWLRDWMMQITQFFTNQ